VTSEHGKRDVIVALGVKSSWKSGRTEKSLKTGSGKHLEQC